jgi:hypothetical protein
MSWFRKPPDLSLSNEYQVLMNKGCVNCNALLEVLKSQNMHNWGALHEILSKTPSVSRDEAGCWAYCRQPPDYYPACLHGLKDDDPKVIQVRDEIIRARQAIATVEEQHKKERSRRLREVQSRRLP